MAFFRRELGPVERFENALKEKLAARQKLANQSSLTEKELAEKRAATERLAVAGADSTRLDRAEASMRAVEDRARTLRAALAELDEQVASAERAWSEAKAQRDRNAQRRRDRSDGRGHRTGRAGIPGQRRSVDRGGDEKSGVDAGSDKIFDQRRGGAPRTRLRRGPDLLGAAIRRRAGTRRQRQRCHTGAIGDRAACI